MKIHSLKYSNKSFGWSLDQTEFQQLTLLVGQSGVGKSRILNSINTIKRISEGDSFNGISWKIEFSTSDSNIFEWSGEFENNENSYQILDDEDLYRYEKDNSYKIIKEDIKRNGKSFARRTGQDIFLNNVKTVKLSQYTSIVHLLKEEEDIRLINLEFKKIIFSDQSHSQDGAFRHTYFEPELIRKYKSFEELQNSNEHIINKMYICQNKYKEEFDKIESRLKSVFPQIIGLKIENPDSTKNIKVPSYWRDYLFIYIKEKGVKKWIHQFKISSGMFRTILHISELFLCPKYSVVLIDEFENSLGVNCLDELTDDLSNFQKNKIQFIITSHHPYIINNINYENWKLVTRKASRVTTHNANEFNLGDSKHQAFIQLTNLEEYTNGIK